MAGGKKAQANGDAFEELIRWQCRQYQAQGKAVIVKQATEFIPIRGAQGQIVRAKVENKAVVDFLGRHGKEPIAIEAKHTQEDRIRLLEVEDHQAEFMDHWIKDGSGYVLVSFGMCDFFTIPWEVWGVCRMLWNMKKGTKAAGVGFACGYQYNGMASLHKDELPDRWRVKCNGRNGLPFLETIGLF